MRISQSSAASRRGVLKLMGSATVAGVSGVAGLGLLSKPAVAATTDLTASNVDITSNAGQLQTLYVQPDMEYEWNGLDNPPDRIDFYVDARLPNASADEGDSYEEIGSEGETISSSNLESSSTKTYSFQNQVSILSHSNIDDKDFEDTGDGWTKNTDVEVRIRTVLTDDQGNTFTDANSDTFTVSLTNEKGSVKGGGQANTGGSAN